MIRTIPERWWATAAAYHEAGHAVVAHCYCRPDIVAASIRPRAREDGIGGYVILDPATPLEPDESGLLALGGLAAHLVYIGRCHRGGTKAGAWAAADSDVEKAWEIFDTPELRGDALELAVDLIRSEWAGVKAVVSQFRAYGNVRGEGVHLMLEHAGVRRLSWRSVT